MSVKYVSSMMMIGSNQYTVVGKMPIADFMAMTGITRDYIAITHNEECMKHLDALPTGLYYYERNYHYDVAPLPVPERHIRYKSARDKRDTLARQAEERVVAQARYRKEAEARRQAIEADRVNRVAEKLYSFDRFNVPWSEAAADHRNTYLARAAEVIALL